MRHLLVFLLPICANESSKRVSSEVSDVRWGTCMFESPCLTKVLLLQQKRLGVIGTVGKAINSLAEILGY
jgi:hypothetical protein